MGAVYEALDETTGTRVAVKLVHSELIKDASSKDDASKLTRFQREAKAAAAIQGAHVARTLDWGTDEESKQPFIVMELLQGEDLQEVLKRVNVLPPNVALRIAAQACEGLHQAHEARVMHRDIKPANLFLSRQESGEIVVKILDFGIAKIRPESENSGETTGLTRTGSMLGSPRYMSPEQARGSRTLDHRTDLWSLGVVLFRTLTGHLPHEDAEAVGEFIVMLCSEPPQSVQNLAPWVSLEIADIVGDALQINREERFDSAAAMLEAIRALLPGGVTLRADEITPIPDETRGSAVPQPAKKRVAGLGSGSGSLSSSDATVPLPLGRASRRAAGRKDDSGSAANTLANAQLDSTTVLHPRRRTAPIAIGIGALVLGGLFGILRGTQLFSDHPATSASETQPVSAPSSSLGALDSNRRANLVILPHDAAVEVDGAPVTPQDGIVEIAGALGSTHRVRLRKDGQEKVAEVVLGASGAQPPKVELVLAATSGSANPTAPLAGPRPTSKKTATPGSSAPPGPTKNPLIPERFE
jgi:serine/threonine protein kinase